MTSPKLFYYEFQYQTSDIAIYLQLIYRVSMNTFTLLVIPNYHSPFDL